MMIDRQDAIRRNTKLLALAQGLVYTSAPVILAAGGIAAADLTGRGGSAGILLAAYFLAAAVAAPIAGRWMDHHGRRGGLIAAHVAVLAGGVGAAAAVASGSFVGLLAAGAVIGAGAGVALLGRGAVADMYPPATRGRAVGLMLGASTVGAVLGSPLVAVLMNVGEELGMNRLVAPWAIVPIVELGAIAAVAALNPDPRDLAVSSLPPGATTGEEAGPTPRRSNRDLLRLPAMVAALAAAAVGQATMIAVMGVGPVVVEHAGHGDGAVAAVLSVHFLGMFALMPLIGAALDRFGRKWGLLAAAIVSGVGVPLGALGGSAVLTGISMFFSGLGWAGAYLGATTIVSDITRPTERAGALGLTDLVVSSCSALGAVLGGVLLEVGGFPAVVWSTAVLVVPVVFLVLRLEEPGRGRSAPVPESA